MGGLTHGLRTNIWAAIAVSLLAAVGLVAIGQTQLASLLACTAGTLLMWKSEIDNPSMQPDLEEA